MVPQSKHVVGSSWSAWGPTATLRLSPDIVAPGDKMISTLKQDHTIASGNSYSTPYVAGMTALYFEHRARQGMPRPNYTQLRALLRNNAIPYMVPGKNLAASVAQQGAGMAHIFRAANASFRASPSALELFDIEQRPTSVYTKPGEITIENPSNSRRTFYLRHIPAVSMRAFHANGEATEEIVTTDIHIEATFTGPQVITLNPNDKASVPITFTIPVELNYDEHWLYSGYIVIDPEPLVNGRLPSDHAVYVPYLGLNGSMKTIDRFFEMRSRKLKKWDANQ
ncbi:hypothetical protein BDF22DRAFT_656313 [Syncephalis plumigaleata]|nr:hypothetical protein BDF22DRAFT_656313 [Syncephalis plumigaleata]